MRYREKHRRLALICGCAMGLGVSTWISAQAQGVTPNDVRSMLESRVGSVSKLQVGEIPQPSLPDGTPDSRYEITPAKRFLGKLLFHEPLRSRDIMPELGGAEDTLHTASCGTCHFGAAGSKAGRQRALGLGGEGHIEMDEQGDLVVVRRQRADLTDAIPTGMVLEDDEGNVLLDGRFDAVDSPPRLSPSVVGLAYNLRLLWDGAAGESDPSLNPDNLPAAESVVQLASGNHRMLIDQHTGLQENAVYRQLFQDAFPDEYAVYLSSLNLDDLINADTIQRAIAAFMRTAITKDTPWDRFLAGDDSALPASQLRGAYLFAAPTSAGGANCIACHSGPALNKVLGDEDGELVEENFINVGIGDHPGFEDARALIDPNLHDVGRSGVTGNPAQDYQFKTPTLRQLSGPFMHSGQFTTVRETIEYFNNGVASDSLAAAAGNLSELFTNPRGSELVGLGLSEEDIDALDDFLSNALFDVGFVRYDPSSPTDSFDLNIDDLTYSQNLKDLGAKDGLLPSLLAATSNDELTRSQTLFVRGRTNADNKVDIADGIFLLNYLFAGGPMPSPMAAADVNYDHRIDLADPIFLFNFLFEGGRPPPMPYPEVGQMTF